MKIVFSQRGLLLVSVVSLSLFFLGCGTSGDQRQASGGSRSGEWVVHAAEPVAKVDPVTVELTRTDAESGGANAQFELGRWYYEGTRVKQDYEEAYEWFLKAANQNHPGGMVYLGLIYNQGLGVNQDHDEALKWFKKAARKDSPQAQFQLGLMYENGTGVSQDYVAAHQWFRKASRGGHPQAEQALDSLTSRMSREQLARVR